MHVKPHLRPLGSRRARVRVGFRALSPAGRLSPKWRRSNPLAVHVVPGGFAPYAAPAGAKRGAMRGSRAVRFGERTGRRSELAQIDVLLYLVENEPGRSAMELAQAIYGERTTELRVQQRPYAARQLRRDRPTRHWEPDRSAHIPPDPVAPAGVASRGTEIGEDPADVIGTPVALPTARSKSRASEVNL
jgi:hypothetical protein